MINELLNVMEKETDTLIEQTKTKPQEMLEFKMNKQTQTFSFSPPINLIEESKWLLGVTSLECTNFVFNKSHENNSFSISTPSYWSTKGGEELINNLKIFLELRSENDIELHVKEVKERGTRIRIGDNEYLKLSDLDTRKNSIIKELN